MREDRKVGEGPEVVNRLQEIIPGRWFDPADVARLEMETHLGKPTGVVGIYFVGCEQLDYLGSSIIGKGRHTMEEFHFLEQRLKELKEEREPKKENGKWARFLDWIGRNV